jgi:hypothetical protein
VEDFKVFAVEAVVGTGTGASLTLVVTLFAGFVDFVCVLVLSAAVFTLFTFAIASALRTDTFVEAKASALGATRVAHPANGLSSEFLLVRANVFFEKSIGTGSILHQASVEGLVQQNIIASFAPVFGQGVIRSSTTVASVMALVANAVFNVFCDWTLSQAELSIFDVLAFNAVVSVGTGARTFAFRVAVAAVLLIDLVNAGKVKILLETRKLIAKACKLTKYCSIQPCSWSNKFPCE